MNNQEMLEAVKCGLKELSNYNDDEINLWINASKRYLEVAGVKPDIINSEKAIGVITLCVDSLRLREASFSETIRWLTIQLSMEGE